MIYAGSIRAVERQIDDLIKNESTVANVVASFVSGAGASAAKLHQMLHHDELGAVAKGTGIALGRIVVMQLVYEAAARCTAVVTPLHAAAADSVPAHVRTMDWEMDFLRPLTIEVAFTRGNAVIAVCTTWAGYVGILTGMTTACPSPYSVSVNFRVSNTGTLWTNISKTLHGAWPVGFLVRHVLCSVGTYDAAVAALATSELIAPCYVVVAGSTAGQGRLITRERTDEVSPWDAASMGDVVQPNMDHWSKDRDEDIMNSMRRRSDVRKALAVRARRAEPSDDSAREALWRLAAPPYVCNDITIYGVVMVPATGAYETRLPGSKGFVMNARGRPTTSYDTCVKCVQWYDPGLNSSAQCKHAGEWHDTYEKCSTLKCAFGLGPSNIGKSHWGCCYETEKATACRKSSPHRPR
jgi:hypothetical protein